MTAEKDPSATPLTSEQTGSIIDGLNKRGATFFTWGQLQGLIERFGPDKKISEIQEKIKDQQDQTLKQ